MIFLPQVRIDDKKIIPKIIIILNVEEYIWKNYRRLIFSGLDHRSEFYITSLK